MSKCSSEAATILTLFCFNLSHWTFDFFSFFLLTMLSIEWRHILAAVVHAVASQHDGWRTVQVVAVGRERTDPVYLSAYKEGPRRYCRFLTFLISHVETRRTTAEWKCLSCFFCASDVMCRTPAEQRTTVYIWGTSAHVQSVTVFDLDFWWEITLYLHNRSAFYSRFFWLNIKSVRF